MPIQFACPMLLLLAASTAQQDPSPAAIRNPAIGAFVPNTGQWDGPAAFVVQGRGASAWLDATGITVELACRVPDPSVEPIEPNRPGGHGSVTRLVRDTLRLEFVGATPVTPQAGELAAGVVNCYFGSDQARWRAGLPTYREVQWVQAWPGVTVTARQHREGLLEFTLACAANVDASECWLQWSGSEAIACDEHGTLILSTPAGDVLQSRPIAWQERADGTRLPRLVRTDLRDNGTFRFQVVDALPGLPILIDPVLTLVGTNDDSACGVATDRGGLVYLAGYSTFPATGRDVAVTCLNTNTNPPTLLWQTWIGGGGDDVAFDIAHRDITFVLTVVGSSTSAAASPLWTSFNATQPTHGGGVLDGFVFALTNTGGLFESTYLGGTGEDWCCRVVTAPGRPTTIAAETTSSTIPNITPARPFAGGTDVLVVQEWGLGWGWSTYLGGANHEGRLWPNWASIHPMNLRQLGLDVDAAGRVLVAGFTNSSIFPTTAGAYQPFFAGTWDAFAAILDPALPPAQQIQWATYFGGGNSDSAFAAKFAPANEVVLAGDSWGAGFPATPGALQTAPGSGNFNDATAIWLRPQQAGPAQRRYATRLGGVETDSAFALTVDPRGHATLGGFCGPDILLGGWPIDAGGWQLTFGGVQDLWVARVRPDGLGRHDLTFGTYLGGSQPDSLFDVDMDSHGQVAIAGATISPFVPGLGNLVGVQNMIGGAVEVLPVGVTRDFAGAAALCSTPPWIELDRQPIANAAFEVLVANAPANAPGVLVFGTAIPFVPVLGASLGIALPAAVSPLLVTSPLGAQVQVLNVPTGVLFPVGLAAQALWLDPLCAPGQDIVVSSARLGF